MQSLQCIESIPAFSNQYQTLYLYLNIWVLYRIAKIKNTGKFFFNMVKGGFSLTSNETFIIDSIN